MYPLLRSTRLAPLPSARATQSSVIGRSGFGQVEAPILSRTNASLLPSGE